MPLYDGTKEPEPTYIAETAAPMGRKEVVAGYGWNALFTLIGKLILPPLLQIFFYRRLGPEEIGVYAVLIPIYMICETLRDAGLALTFVADREADDKREGEYASLSILNSIVFAAVVFFLRDPLAEAFHLPQLHWGLTMVAVAILLTGISTIPANKLQKKARFRDAGLIDLISTVASFAIAFVLVLLGFGYKALVWQFIARSLLFTWGCIALEPVRLNWVHKDVLSAIWKRAGANLINNILFTFYTVADNLLISKLFGRAAIGYYNAAYTFGTKPIDFFTVPLGRTLLIAYTRKSDDLRSLSNIFSRTVAASVLLMVPLYVLIGFFARPLILFLLGDKYGDAAPILTLLAIYCGCRSVGSLCGNVLVAMNKPIYNVYGWLLAYATVGAVLWWKWPQLRLLDVVAALAAGAAVVYCVNGIAAFTILKPNPSDRAKIAKAFGLAGFASGLVILIALLPINASASLGLALIVVPVIHLSAVSAAFGPGSLAWLSGNGRKAIWESL